MGKQKKLQSKLEVNEDRLVDVLVSSLNQMSKKNIGIKAEILGDQHKSQSDVKSWISTGSDTLDLAISNRPNGGIPTGRITEITGLEQSGKSLLAAQIIANTQKMGGIGVYIDTENAVHSPFFEALGVDLSKMLYIPLELIEDVFTVIEKIILDFKEQDTNKIVTIVVDSVAGATTKVESEADYDKDGWATAKAIIMSKSLRKITNLVGRENIALIFTNQLRQKLGVSFGDPWTTSGGKALGFHSSVRMRLYTQGTIRDKNQRIIGITTKAKITKNRLGPPLREVSYDVYFDSGIDNPGGWFLYLKQNKLIKSSGAWYTLVIPETGEEIKFQSKDFASKIYHNPEYHDEVYKMICDDFILRYKKKDQGIDPDSIVKVEEEVELN